MTPDTMMVLTEHKPRTDLATPWNCKKCGASLGHIGKDIRDWHYLRPSNARHIRIYGDAEIVCQFCGARCNWCWNEHALKRVLRYRERRV